MRDITADEIRSEFGEKTFLRGLQYFESNHVGMGVIKGTTLTGTVRGSMPHPYTVEVDIDDDIHCRCTCPVGAMCKHGVALLLQWIHDNDSFVDADHLSASLRKKSKEELLNIIDSILEDDPALASKLAFSEIVKEKKIDTEAISKRLRHIDRELLDYYAMSSVAKELEDIKVIGDNCAGEGRFNEAVEVYLSLIKWGVDTFRWGVDDSYGDLGDVMYSCIEDFTKTSRELGEKQKRNLICRVLNIVDSENYGLGTDDMLYGLATKENIFFIETELLKRITTSEESLHVEYSRRRVLELLSNLYRELGMQQDALRVIEEAGLKNAGDYVLMAKVLMDQNEHEKALEVVRKGMFGEEDKIDIRLNDLYFALLHKVLSEGNNVEVNEEEVVTFALHALSHSFYIDPGRYAIMKDVLTKIGEHESFISVIKEKCEEDMVIEVLSYENRIEEAIDIALSSTTVHPLMLIEVAEAARKKGKTEEAIKLTLKAVKRGLTSADAPVDELINLVVAESDESVLREAVDHIQYVGIARLFVAAFLERNQEYVMILLKRFIRHIKKEELLTYAANLEVEYAKEIFRLWISEVINRSYRYYDDAVDILKTLKGITTEKEWGSYISVFMEKNRGKKKLLERIETASL